MYMRVCLQLVNMIPPALASVELILTKCRASAKCTEAIAMPCSVNLLIGVLKLLVPHDMQNVCTAHGSSHMDRIA